MTTEWLTELADKLLEAADWLAWCHDPDGAHLLANAAQALLSNACSEIETQARLDPLFEVEEKRPCLASL